jgi:hypothetical protein
MSITTLIFIALLVWMVWMHARPGGHGGCGRRGSHSGGERDGR